MEKVIIQERLWKFSDLLQFMEGVFQPATLQNETVTGSEESGAIVAEGFVATACNELDREVQPDHNNIGVVEKKTGGKVANVFFNQENSEEGEEAGRAARVKQLQQEPQENAAEQETERIRSAASHHGEADHDATTTTTTTTTSSSSSSNLSTSGGSGIRGGVPDSLRHPALGNLIKRDPNPIELYTIVGFGIKKSLGISPLATVSHRCTYTDEGPQVGIMDLRGCSIDDLLPRNKQLPLAPINTEPLGPAVTWEEPSVPCGKECLDTSPLPDLPLQGTLEEEQQETPDPANLLDSSSCISIIHPLSHDEPLQQSAEEQGTVEECTEVVEPADQARPRKGMKKRMSRLFQRLGLSTLSRRIRSSTILSCWKRT